jgi:hypothetical protein
MKFPGAQNNQNDVPAEIDEAQLAVMEASAGQLKPDGLKGDTNVGLYVCQTPNLLQDK